MHNREGLKFSLDFKVLHPDVVPVVLQQVWGWAGWVIASSIEWHRRALGSCPVSHILPEMARCPATVDHAADGLIKYLDLHTSPCVVLVFSHFNAYFLAFRWSDFDVHNTYTRPAVAKWHVPHPWPGSVSVRQLFTAVMHRSGQRVCLSGNVSCSVL